MPIPPLNVKLVEDNGSYNVRASAAGHKQVSNPSEFEFLEGSRTAEVIKQIAAGDCRLDDLRDVGSQLFVALFSGEVGQLFERFRTEASSDAPLVIRFSLPRELQLNPWEALYDEKKDGFLVSNPKYCIVREPPEDLRVVEQEAEISCLRVLVVIPGGSGLSVEHEWRNLYSSVEKFGDAIELVRLDGRVTPDRLQTKLTEQAWNVVHFIGHGEVSQEGTFKIRLSGDEASDAEYWMEAETFSSLFYEHPPRLVVLNCCLGAAASPVRTLSGLGPSLLKAGVPAVVAMRYEIPDRVALDFANTFYRDLLVGEQPGRVDLAITNVRRSLYRNQGEYARGFITPILYLAPSQEQLFQFSARPIEISSPKPLAAPPETSSSFRLPRELVEALRERKCNLVLGPEILRVGISRSGTVPPGPKELVERLSRESNYPRIGDMELSRQDGEWMASLLLPCVCQYYENYEKKSQRFKLIEAVRKAYERMEPPSGVLAIAAMNFPVIVYTHFDGLLQEALDRTHRAVQVATRVDQRREVASDEGLLVCVRGTLRDPDTLVLTEEDHEQVWERMGRLPRQMLELMRGGLGHCALYLGVSPRDQLVRRLSRQLLEGEKGRLQGPKFIVCPDPTAADDAYWRRYDVQWIKSSIEEFLGALTRAVA